MPVAHQHGPIRRWLKAGASVWGTFCLFHVFYFLFINIFSSRPACHALHLLRENFPENLYFSLCDLKSQSC